MSVYEAVERLQAKGLAYEGGLADLTDVLRWAKQRMTNEAGTTHWEDCWRIHLPCAVKKIELDTTRLRQVEAASLVQHDEILAVAKRLVGAAKQAQIMTQSVGGE